MRVEHQPNEPTSARPTFSVVTTVFDPVPADLRACIASVERQRSMLEIDVGVEHVLVDDASTDPEVRAVLRATAERAGAEVAFRAHNGGIAVASNDALAIAGGEWIVLLDHDDELAAGALAILGRWINDHPGVDVVYSDHDVLRPDGRCADPVYKPDFSPERLRQTNYITHLVAIRRSAIEAVGGFTEGVDGAQDHDLLLRLMERGVVFGHVPEVLVHWRQSPRSVATDTANKSSAFERGVDVVASHLHRAGIDATVEPGAFDGIYRIRRRSPADRLVSVVVPTRGSIGTVWGRRRTFVVDAVRSIVERSHHRALEFVVVADADTPVGALTALQRVVGPAGLTLRIVEYDEPFNFSRKVNLGVGAASGDAVLLLNDDTELIEPDSIGVLLGHLSTSHGERGERGDRGDHGGVGAVGARLLYADGTLQHGGHVYHHEFMHAMIGYPGDHPGPHRMLAIERECAGVTAAALMTSAEVVDEVGGFPDDLPLHFNDVDFCVAVRRMGRRIIWTPHASWHHFEGRTRRRGATIDEWDRAARGFPDGEPVDPYANPNLVPKRADWLELPGRSGAPPYYLDATGAKRWA